MSVRTISFEELQEQLADLLTRAAEGDDQYVIERDGREFVVIIGARHWQALPRESSSPSDVNPASSGKAIAKVSARLDGLGPEYRLASNKQARTEELLARDGDLTLSERAELDSLLREAEEIMLRRAAALNGTA